MLPDPLIEQTSWSNASSSPTATARCGAALHKGMEPTYPAFGEPDNLTFKEWVQLHTLLAKCGRSERARVHRQVVVAMRTAADGLTDNRTVVPVRIPLTQKAALNALATLRDTTRSDVLRDAVREYLKDHGDEVRQAIEAGRDAE